MLEIPDCQQERLLCSGRNAQEYIDKKNPPFCTASTIWTWFCGGGWRLGLQVRACMRGTVKSPGYSISTAKTKRPSIGNTFREKIVVCRSFV